ncbi:MAG: serine hydrolase [Desulfobulbus propionicus]|nr:MAG: serine hydrolase [Desulfobulbus propionicus]PIE60419.1 MAG: serine hydrolase [Desulfobulbus propionicus]
MAKSQSETLEKILIHLCATGVAENVFPGCVAGVSIGRGVHRVRATGQAGKLSRGSQKLDVTSDSYYDLASLTKPLCTAGCIVKLIEQGCIDWNTPLADYFNALKTGDDKERITVGHLVSHSAGFRAYTPYFKRFSSIFAEHNKRTLLHNILNEELEYKPGEKNIYSDWGYILLGELIKRITTMELDTFFNQTITKPLGLTEHLFFLPLENRHKPIPPLNIAPTEQCDWRNTVMQSQVHDEHCYLLGGVAGHAGLFGNIYGVLFLCEHILDSWVEKRTSLSGIPFYQLFNHYTAHSNWYLGFDTPTIGNSTSGQYFSPNSAGHLGFTGTSLWMDPEKEIIVVLLSNRINPTRENEKIRQFRPFFHDSIMEKIQKNPPPVR